MTPRLLVASVCMLGMLELTVRPAEADDTSADARIDQLCEAVAQVQAPAGDEPSSEQAAALSGCDSEALYYGIGVAADPMKARLCAFTQQAQEKDPGLEGFSGSHMLMLIYGNGKGATQNIPYATHLACLSSFAQMERELRVRHLQAIGEKKDGGVIDFCDDSTAGLTGGYCAKHLTRIAGVAVDKKIAAFAARVPHRAQRQFVTLKEKQVLWGKARAQNETDLSGTLRAALEIDEEALQKKDFVDMLERLERKPLPPLGKAELQDAAHRMMIDLAKLSGKAGIGGTTIDYAGIDKAQEAFLAYRKAWGDFAATAYPQWGRSGAEAWVTMKRADMLDHLVAWLK